MNGCDSNGFPKDWLLKYYRDLADGQFGLITTGFMYLQRAGKSAPGQACMYTNEHANSWKSTIDYIHKQDSKILFQIVDAGTFTSLGVCGERPRGASPQGPGTREMTKMEIAEVIEEFTKAAVRLQEVGADGIQIHSGHGFLFSQFLCPANNKRTDEYGGSPENRRRILQEVVSSIRSATDKNFIVSTKINGDDCIPNGVKPQDLAETVKAIKGMDLYEITCGFQVGQATGRVPNKSKNLPDYPFKYGYNVDSMKVVRKANPDVPLSLCGGFKTLDSMESALAAGATLVSFGRPSIADTHLPQHIKDGDTKVKCVFCSQCGGADGVRCAVYGTK